MKQILWVFSVPLLALALALESTSQHVEPISPKATPALLLKGEKEMVGVLVNPPSAIVEAVERSLKKGARADLVCVGLACSPLSVWKDVLAIADKGGNGLPGGAVVVDDAFVLVLDPRGWYKGSGQDLVMGVKKLLKKRVQQAKEEYAERRRKQGR